MMSFRLVEVEVAVVEVPGSVPVPVPVMATLAVIVIVPFAALVFLKQVPGAANGQKHDQIRKQLQENPDSNNGPDPETDEFGGLVSALTIHRTPLKRSQAPWKMPGSG
jgi:hypothetical protein